MSEQQKAPPRTGDNKIGIQDARDEVGESYLPPTVTQQEVNARNRKYWEQKGGDTFPNV